MIIGFDKMIGKTGKNCSKTHNIPVGTGLAGNTVNNLLRPPPSSSVVVMWVGASILTEQGGAERKAVSE